MGSKILVLEDEAIVAMDIAAELQDAGWTVVGPAGSVEMAERHILQERPDAAVLDVNLSGTTSFDLARRLRADGVDVVFLTGYARSEIPDALADCPVVSKPLNMQMLVTVLPRPTPG